MSLANMIRESQMQLLNIPVGAEAESDLTELSWLTDNINVLAPTSMAEPKATLGLIHSKTLKRKEHLDKAPDSPSSVSSSSSCSSLSPCLSPCSSCQLASSKKNDHQKPCVTLSCLIFMALEESQQKALPVREIYQWIERKFAYYRNNENSGWKSSIRHNLSFSKCFVKLDRKESVLLWPKAQAADPAKPSGRKRRAPNSVGTCWKVNEDCRPYLVHTLKKSTFWTRNCQNFANLAKMMDSADLGLKNATHVHQKKEEFEANELEASDLMDFVQKQQEQLSSSMKSDGDDDRCKLDLSASSSSLSSVLSSDSACKRLRIDEDKLNLSSDLEIEVASTLVDMKRIASRNK
ncbi:forkhead box N2 isoform X1 [Brachionus plicatilis]|uniref:Forkhead box N2 isoform X1 n=1 Tax=Brachionus plicatilis TaxID=10195 RepID=A0A3M7PBP3_BRAPC|nr:forkhead box N2 isoform X1 [Brachionus plicatilis]